ncbi:phenylacetic acid degradation operon negative regulatory protein PaaX [uncultured Castellaniella sp.]|uniref:phenylacetic acid degradation operon negative regulatory protein PaaX n=1 Tax=uncultured Castellaniella sp. TaxID=647907 RepID=UPI002608768C|nr:phenylacetic acid degradation operon negative regulatory protein PaaX [uncultured Castellaniella sp.]
MIPAIQHRIDHFRQQQRVRAGSLIMSVFGDAVLPRGGRIWLGSLIRLLEPLGLNERLVRTSVFRLGKEKWLRADSHGRRAEYVLTDSGRLRFEEASRHIYSSHAPIWDRRWRLILVVGELDPRQRERLRQALQWQGFGSLGSDCFVHPSTHLEAAYDTLEADGLGDMLGCLLPLLAADARIALTASDADLVARAWNLDRLAESYAAFVGDYLPILAELRRDRQVRLEPEEAFLLRVLMIHDYRRLLLRDPELPEVLLPADWPGQSARMVCRELYRRLAEPSERHLDAQMLLADGTVPERLEDGFERFPSDDPLVSISL